MAFLVELAALSRPLQETIADTVNAKFKESVGSVNADLLHHAVLGRHAYYLACSYAEADRKGTTKGLTPRWSRVLKCHQSMQTKYPSLRTYSFDDKGLTALATHASARRGSHSLGFYFAILQTLFHASALGEFDWETFQGICPSAERGFVQAAEAFCLQVLKEATTSDNREVTAARKKQFTVEPAARLETKYPAAQRATFDRYFHKNLSRGKDGLRFVIYRPRVSEPTQFMKSFLSVNIGEADPAGDPEGKFQFTHVYEPPSTRSDSRKLTTGIVVPLLNGVYLIGGQRSTWSAEEAAMGMMAICLPWHGINNGDRELPGLMLTANHEGVPIISRIAARVTSVSHSDHLKLGAVEDAKLVDNIFEDLLVETGFKRADGAFSNSKQDEELKAAGRIREMCNNVPRKCEVPSGIQSVGGRKSLMLSDEEINKQIEKSFGSADNPKWETKDGKPFVFWDMLRCPPLSSK